MTHQMTSEPTIDEALRHARDVLANTTDSPRLDAELLLAQVLNCSRTHLRAWPQHKLTIEQTRLFLKLTDKRRHGEPIAYLVGQREFWDMTITVTPDTLIPRPETEHLVELALERIPPSATWRIADLGTGTGIIALAIARERPGCQILATDVSPAALRVARDNAAQLGVTNIRFGEGSWCEPLSGETFEMIVANPPYIHPDDPHLQQGDLRFEPRSALQSGPDGLADIRQIGTCARQHLRPPGWLLLEHGYDQGPAVSRLLQDWGYQQVKTEKDLAQNDRISLGSWTP